LVVQLPQFKLGLKQAKIAAVVQPISGIVMLLTIAIILGFGALEIATGAITAGTLIAMIFYVIQLSMPLINLSTLVTELIHFQNLQELLSVQ
jgi:ATP-binding cassette subfamily B protein AbcA/BmrA